MKHPTRHLRQRPLRALLTLILSLLALGLLWPPGPLPLSTLLDLGIAALALYLTLGTLRFLRTAQQAQGTLIGYRSERDDEGDWLHQPVFRFPDAHGRIVTACNPRHVWVVRRLAVGQTCALLYNPANPDQVLRNTWLDLWFLPTALWAVSLLTVMRALAG